MSDADKAFQSYGRCCNQPLFFETFYSCFMGKSDEVRKQFVDTDMKSQHSLLRGGIMWLLMHARGMSDSKLQDLGKSHNRHGYSIAPHLYDLWLDALMEAVQKHDVEYTPELEMAWRKSITPGINKIRSMY